MRAAGRLRPGVSFEEKEPPSFPPGGSNSLLAVIPPAQVRTAVTLFAAMRGLSKCGGSIRL